MKRACDACGHVHGGDWAIAVYRFRSGATLYRAASDVDGHLWSTRAEAVADECARRAAREAS